MSEPLPKNEIERLRSAGYVVVPIQPTSEMLKVGAPSCFIVPDGTWEIAIKDAAVCYRSMIELGCL